ncbi:MAG TPA: M24 family metallopeptidase [Planctomycetota bacterium]|nr:M24 family metallopeptidase [Planctomycetota bacterium]
MNRVEEIAAKRALLREALAAQGLDGAVFSTQAMFSWYTAGGENRVVTAADGGAATLVLTAEADYALTNNIEAPRVGAEALPSGSGIKVLDCPWHEDDERLPAKLAELTAGRKLAGDAGQAGCVALPEAIRALTYRLLEPEVGRYEELGREASYAMEGACRRAEPGMTEEEVAAVLAEEVYARGLVPTVILVASDERIQKYRHPLPTEKRITDLLMVVLCARRWGLIASLTRMVYFGRKLPEDLARRHRAVQAVDSAFILNTRDGRTAEEVFKHGLVSYDANGFRDEWKLHHQGGPTGYHGRSYRARPGEKRRVVAPQAYAWNPSITGTKSEDTVLAVPGGAPPKMLTQPVDWPTTQVEWGGQWIPRADILLL